MVAKVRELVTCRSAWETLAKKLTTPQHETFARLGRCICPTFLVSDAQDSTSHAESQKATNESFSFLFPLYCPWVTFQFLYYCVSVTAGAENHDDLYSHGSNAGGLGRFHACGRA